MLNLISKLKTKNRKKFKSKKKTNYYSINIIIIILIVIIILSIFLIFKNLKIILLQENSQFFPKKLNQNHLLNKNKTKKYIYYNKKEIIDDYLSSVPIKFNNSIYGERKTLEKYLNLTDLSKETNKDKIFEIKQELLSKFLSLLNKDNFTEIKYIFFTDINQFGNRIIILNNFIYYCEILGFKNVYLNSNIQWYIKDKIITDNINITMMPSKDIDCNAPYIACFKSQTDPVYFFYFPKYIKPQIRLNMIKNEIKKNLPKVEINPNDLYIHIRSGHIFNRGCRSSYTQPPLCFYKYIINNFKFRNIYIIAENKNNPIIDKILKEYQNVIYQPHVISLDIAYLSNSYNLVASVSSFLLVSVKLNDNLKNYFEYDIYRNSEKFVHLHHYFYYFPMNFTIYSMKPSLRYKNEMFVFENLDSQIKLMMDEICINNFTIIEPNV